jgi:plastocyanin
VTTGRRIARLAAVAIVLAALVAGCSGAGNGAGASPVATTSVDLPPSYRFAPADISVAAGATVTWTNNDHFSHSVQFLDGGLPTDPLMMEPGQAQTFTLTAPGTYAYQCHLHPQNMKGTIHVTG